ncbi:hypothetical protein L7F22_047716 [Adiantum nelumboides]|nr:hypothetical protein [Adiantum nelumboides]
MRIDQAVSAANTFLNLASSSSSSSSASSLSTQREVSSIPRLLQSDQDSDSSFSSTSTSEKKDSNWVYPSPSQFFQAMKRKAAQNLYDQPKEEDMPIVVPIHNAVNERAWKQLLEWENTWDSSTVEKCGGVKTGQLHWETKEKTWRAWTRELMGYQPPFDRHDWLVDRCGHRVRYIIDFYSGKQKAPTSASSADLTTSDGRPKEFVSFYLDVRPAPDTLEGWLMRGRKSWKNWDWDLRKARAAMIKDSPFQHILKILAGLKV